MDFILFIDAIAITKVKFFERKTMVSFLYDIKVIRLIVFVCLFSCLSVCFCLLLFALTNNETPKSRRGLVLLIND
jgi:hypothetical protein